MLPFDAITASHAATESRDVQSAGESPAPRGLLDTNINAESLINFASCAND